LVSHATSLDNLMLVTPTLEWQDRLSNSYARTDNPDLSGSHPAASLLQVGGEPSLQRRRLEKDMPAASDWDSLYTLDPVSGMCLPTSTSVKLIGRYRFSYKIQSPMIPTTQRP
jgi:hypothetical protein